MVIWKSIIGSINILINKAKTKGIIIGFVKFNVKAIAIKDIINKACKMNGNKDKFPKKWLFHYRWSKKKEGIKHPIYKKTIKFIKVAGRTTAMIPDMQKIGKKRS